MIVAFVNIIVFLSEIRPSNSPREVRTKKPESEYDFEDEEDLKEDECYNDIDDSTFNQPFPASPKSRRQPIPASPKARHPPGSRVQLPGMLLRVSFFD